jgi:hypothetical protein
MKNAEGKLMTREEASMLLEEVLMTLAKNAVHNKRLTEYADELERYIAFLDKEKGPQEEEDEPKAE